MRMTLSAQVLYLSCFLGLTSVAAAETGENSTLEIELREGLLTLNVDAPLDQVLRAIGEQGGFAVTLDGNLQSRITSSFSDVPLVAGIRRLTGDQPLVILHESTTSERSGIRELRVYAQKDGLQPIAKPTGGPRLSSIDTSPSALKQQILKDIAEGERDERLDAILNLSVLPEQDALEILTSVITQDSDPDVRVRAVSALAMIGGDDAAATLQTAIADNDPTVRDRALRALGQNSGSSAIEMLGDVALANPDRRMRRTALRLLAKRNDPEALSYLEQAVKDPDESVRSEARRALERQR